jgi:predicted metal-binding protein
MPEDTRETVLSVCTTCRAAGDPAEPRAGARLLAALIAEAAREPVPGLAIEGVECLSVCKRPCSVAVASAGRWTYVYGDFDALENPQDSARTILAGLRRYQETPDGLVPWRERPEAFRKGVVARIPPLTPTRAES